MWYSIDRLEGELAVCEGEDGERLHIPRGELPKGVREGSILRCEGGKWVPDPQAEAQRRAKLFRMQEDLFG